MKKGIIFILLMISLVGMAQTPSSFKIGYLNKDELVEALPEVQSINTDLISMQRQYDIEYKRMQDEYNQKVKRFLDTQDKLQEAIRLARQTEITEYELRLRAYEKRVKKEMDKMRQDAYAPILAKLYVVIKKQSKEMELNLVLDASTPIYMDDNCIDLNKIIYSKMITKK